MEPTEKIDELDRTFDLLLVLLGIITAALFQFQSTRLPLEIAASNPNLMQKEIFDKVNEQITIWLRVLFIPLILLIGVWFVNRISLRARIRVRKSISEFCYVMCFTILGHDIVFFIGAATFRPEPFLGALSSRIEVIFVILISLGLIYFYEIPFIHTEHIRTRKEKFKRIWKPILIRTFATWFIALAIVNNIHMAGLGVYT